MREFRELKTEYSAGEYFLHTDEFNEEAIPELGSDPGEPLEQEEEGVKGFANIAKAALIAFTGALLLMQVFHPRWMLIPDPVRESIGIGKHQHTPSEEWIIDHEATCTEDGYGYITCIMCGEVLEEETYPAKGHIASGVWIREKAPTCTEAGKDVRKCTVCGEDLEVQDIPALGHKPAKEWTVTVKPKCTEKGEEVRICTVCGEITEKREVPAAGHKFGNWITTTYSTCTTRGSEYRKCSVCGHTETRQKGLIDHNYVLKDSSAASCESSGYRLYECTMCGDSYRETMPATGHSFAATRDETGMPYAYCTRCGKSAVQLGYDDQYNEYMGSDGDMHERVIVYLPDGSEIYAYF